MHRNALTFVEVLVVVAIVAIMSGLFFIVEAPSREVARQRVCASQLRQLYVCYSLYADDFGPSGFAGMEEVSFMPFNLKNAAKTYGASEELFFCPDATNAMHEKLGSTYILKLGINPWKDAADPVVKQYLEELRTLGPAASITTCDVHDMVFYGPHEVDVDPLFAQPFRVDLKQDGSIQTGRSQGARSKFPGF
jgi:prepilin-type N-terminal cleavage/methylation domain-containing protein